jgi:hypothetical protein
MRSKQNSQDLTYVDFQPEDFAAGIDVSGRSGGVDLAGRIQ